ncbi:MAG: hypothetical protein HKN36_12825 [Hellea sp.]|nr:hypothetical protein [Hellea sp.]RZV36150.1 MAG: hypothetical protein EX271_12520 [Acidimicrobiales bacterium]
MAVPLLLMTSLSLDAIKREQQLKSIEAALDSSALFAVQRAELTDAEKIELAKSLFEENYVGGLPVDLEVLTGPDSLIINATSASPSFLGGMIGVQNFDIAAETEAVISTSQVVCLLALDPTSEKAIEFKDNARFSAPACTVQSNSTHDNAIYSSLSSPVSSAGFCSVGGGSGYYTPALKGTCSPIANPYASKSFPVSPSTPCQPNTIISDMTITPGVFCGGLKIDKARVTMAPGVYHIEDELLVTSTSELIGNGVTILLKGEKGSLKIDNDATIKLKAPATGETAGLVFWQDPMDGSPSPAPVATGLSEISASGGLSIIGTAYFRTQELKITSDKPVATHSPAMSIIAYRIQFAGDSDTVIHVNHEAGGVPPILPRSDDGARIVR